MKAMWNNAVIAESDDIVSMDGNSYFPPDSVRPGVLQPSAQTSLCPWKGTARYHSLLVDGRTNPDAAWFYPDPKPAASGIAGRIAFWKGVTVVA